MKKLQQSRFFTVMQLADNTRNVLSSVESSIHLLRLGKRREHLVWPLLYFQVVHVKCDFFQILIHYNKSVFKLCPFSSWKCWKQSAVLEFNINSLIFFITQSEKAQLGKHYQLPSFLSHKVKFQEQHQAWSNQTATC